MRETSGRVHKAGLALLTALIVAACGDEVVGPAPEPALPVQYKYSITLFSLKIVQDCDDEAWPTTIVDNDTEGEFAYRFKIVWPDGGTTVAAATAGFPAHSNGSGLLRAGTGNVISFGPSGKTFTRTYNGPQVLAVDLVFAATEWDSRLDGWYRDEWMAGEEKSWTIATRTDAAGTQASITLGPAKCQVRANFKARIVAVE